jgi:5-methylcytosine-specific restriction endonuclease McrBC GTP-binding regulatory subunit McrB
MNQEILDKIVSLAAKDPDRYQRRSGDDSTLNRFYELFPLESLPGLTLDQYCLGKGSKEENFSWWLEGGLKKSIGSYSPGTARGHLIYLQKGGGYYMHRYFADLGPEKAIEIVRKSLYAIASCSTLEEARVVDDSQALAKRAALDDKKYVVNGDARTLRILSMYHPEWMLPINSIDHLEHFLKKLTDEADYELPKKSIDLVIQLTARLDEVRKATGLEMTPWGFSKLLYNEELGIVPPKRGSIYKDDTAGEDGKPEKTPWWKRFFDSEEQGHAAFDLLHEACVALGVSSTQGSTAQRVSFTNTKKGGEERLRLNCGNTLVLEITSSPTDKPNSCFIARIEGQDSSKEPVGRFSTPYAGQMHGLYRIDLGDLLEADSASRKLFFTALGDVAATYTNIKKRHHENAHRERLLYSAFHHDARAKMFADGPTAKPSDDEIEPMPDPTRIHTKQGTQKNLILYGPPGTGKTYSTIDRALEIIDPGLVQSTQGEKDGRAKRKARFDELLQTKRIGFVTFHQSFSYEDFVEGLKASTDENGQVKYEVEDGIFKQMCSTAAAASAGGSRTGPANKIEPAGRAIWKMSLGNTLGPDAAIYDECIENGYLLLGWGEGVDFTGASTREAIKAKVEAEKPDGWESEYTVTACHAFVNTMKPGDLIIVSDGNHKFRAIGVVKGDYRNLPVDEDREFSYQQCRDVEWIRTYAPSLPTDQLMTVAFSQASIYRLKPPAINLDLVRSLLNEDGSVGDDAPRPFVLIIDEINRGNISRVFGELITLIEDSKRTGKPEALSVKLPYSKEMFSVPANLYLIGTMNTADRSLAQVDIALRRRFVFEELMPDTSILSMIPKIDGIYVGKMLTAMNRRIEVLYDREHTIGHTFFLSLNDDPSLAEMERIFSGRILPLLEEYFFEDWEKIRLVLGDHQKPAAFAMITPKYSNGDLEALFGADPNHPINTVYQRNKDALSIPESYIGIYDPAGANGKSEFIPTS